MGTVIKTGATSLTYADERSHVLREVRTHIISALPDVADLFMLHDPLLAARLARDCQQAGRALSSCMNNALERLEQGCEYASICDASGGGQACLARPLYPATAQGGRASALVDAALLVASIDARAFIRHYNAGKSFEQMCDYLGAAQHSWLLALRDQWQADGLARIVPAAVFERPVPAAEPRKDGFMIILKTVAHALHITKDQPSPFEYQGGRGFSGCFQQKLWPYLQTPPENAPQGCQVGALSIPFQEWYFSVGKTQAGADRRGAEDVFIALRTQFHQQAQTCSGLDQAGCNGQCVQRSFDQIAAHPFKQNCQSAVRHILHRNNALG